MPNNESDSDPESDSDSDYYYDLVAIRERMRKEERENATLLDGLSKLEYPCSKELFTTCNKLFWGKRKWSDEINHIKTLSILRLNAQAGYRLCISLLWKLEATSKDIASRLPEELDLAFEAATERKHLPNMYGCMDIWFSFNIERKFMEEEKDGYQDESTLKEYTRKSVRFLFVRAASSMSSGLIVFWVF